jgi:hypothetical protein
MGGVSQHERGDLALARRAVWGDWLLAEGFEAKRVELVRRCVSHIQTEKLPFDSSRRAIPNGMRYGKPAAPEEDNPYTTC